MDKTPKDHLDFLEFVISRINAESEGWWSLDGLAEEYAKVPTNRFSIDEIRHLAALYKNKYFITSSKSDFQIFPKPETKELIKDFGSLSNYIKAANRKESRRKKVDVIKSLAPIIISIISIIIAVIFGIANLRVNSKMDSLKMEIKQKDSIIFKQNNDFLKSDTIMIQKTH